jgi:hypothetical protein
MESGSLRIRIAQLIHKSKRALRAYTSLERGTKRGWGEIQASEWRAANADLMKELSGVLQVSNPKSMTKALCVLRDRFYFEWREIQGVMAGKQKDLITASETSDFVRSAILSSELVSLRARNQSAEAAYKELRALVKDQPGADEVIELSHDQVVHAEEKEKEELPARRAATGKVIQLKQQRFN